MRVIVALIESTIFPPSSTMRMIKPKGSPAVSTLLCVVSSLKPAVLPMRIEVRVKFSSTLLSTIWTLILPTAPYILGARTLVVVTPFSSVCDSGV